MTEATSVPKKKKFGFKKAAWQTDAPAAGKDDDMFSHSRDFAAIVADQAKRNKAKREEEKEKAEAERRRKADEQQRKKKRRKTAAEEGEDVGRGASGDVRRGRTNNNG